jgi:putative peptidoglycan lipid II flippase
LGLSDLSGLKPTNAPPKVSGISDLSDVKSAADQAASGDGLVVHAWPEAPKEPERAATTRGLLASRKTMAIASLASRVTGFLRTAAIAAALGVVGNGVADAYNLANMLPNMVYELLIGGVLSSVLIPLLVRAQEGDDDDGLSYTQRLLAVATAALGGATVLAALGAPLLTWAMVRHGAQRDLATAWATLLLPEIFFYGIGALFTAVLNARNVYGAPAWAPVLNNVIILFTVGVYLLLPGPTILSPSTITNTQVLVLGIGTTGGIAAQALVLWPWLRRVGFHWAWRFRAPAPVELAGGPGSGMAGAAGSGMAGRAGAGGARGSGGGLRHERNLIGWVIGYVAVSQVGLLVVSRVALSRGGLTMFTSADMLFQVPYGILGVSLLTVLMPRMSRSAARGDFGAVVEDLSLGIRLSALALLPVTAGLMVLGPSLGTLIFFHGATAEADARNVGVVLAMGAFGLLPFAVVMLQLRVFYAMHDARTPTLVNVAMVTVKIALVLAAEAALPGRQVIQSLAVATSVSYLTGAIVGHLALERRLGRLGLGPAVLVVGKVAGAAVGGGAAAWAVVWLVGALAGQGRIGSLAAVLFGSAIGGAVCVFLLMRAHLPEVRQIMASAQRSAGKSVDRVSPR